MYNFFMYILLIFQHFPVFKKKSAHHWYTELQKHTVYKTNAKYPDIVTKTNQNAIILIVCTVTLDRLRRMWGTRGNGLQAASGQKSCWCLQGWAGALNLCSIF